ncbi:hypothetical protein ABK040_006251 [Willaertia magna]
MQLSDTATNSSSPSNSTLSNTKDTTIHLSTIPTTTNNTTSTTNNNNNNNNTMNNNKNKIMIDFLSGSLSAIIADTSLQPLDTIKTRQQYLPNINSSFITIDTMIKDNKINQNELQQVMKDFKYKNTFNAFTTILRKEGIQGLYKGWTATMFGTVPAGAIYFGGYEYIKKKLLPYFDKDNSSFVFMIAGSSAELLSSAIFIPCEVIKCRYQTSSLKESLKNTNVIKSMLEIIQKEGVKGLYSGYSASIARDVPYSALQFFLYEVLKKKVIYWNHNTKNQNISKNIHDEMNNINFLQTIVIGGIAGGTAAIFTNPMDVLKTRLQANNSVNTYGNKKMVPLARDLIKYEGYKCFYAGALPRVIWVTSYTAIIFACFEKIAQVLSKNVFHEENSKGEQQEDVIYRNRVVD